MGLVYISHIAMISLTYALNHNNLLGLLDLANYIMV